MLLRLFYCVIVGIILNSCLASASFAKWTLYSTEHFSLYAPKQYKLLAYESLYYLETHRQKVVSTTKSNHPKHLYVVLQDMGSMLNGYSMTHTNKISLFSPAPASQIAFMFPRNWLETVAIHEQFHNHHFHHTTLNTPFGLLSTQLFLPDLFTEGMAVYMESQLHPYQGRLNDGFYESVLLTKAAQNKLASYYHSSLFHNHFPLGQHYIYGSGFVNYLTKTYSNNLTEDLISWYFNMTSLHDFKGFSTLNEFTKYHYKKSFSELYTDYYSSLKTQSRTWKLPPADPLSTSYSMFSPIIDNNTMYFIKKNTTFNAPYSPTTQYHLIAKDLTSSKTKVLRVFYEEPIQDALRVKNNMLYLALTTQKKGHFNIDQLGFGKSVQLYSYNLTTQIPSLLYTGPLLAYDILEDDTILFSIQDNTSHKSFLKKDIYSPKTLATFPFYVTQLNYYQNILYMGVKHPHASRDIYTYDIATQKLTPLLNSQAKEYAFSLNKDNLYFSANYNHRYQTYQLNLTTNTLSSLDGPSFMLAPVVNDTSVYYTGLTSTSFGLYQSRLQPLKYTLNLPPETPIDLYTTTPFKEFSSTVKTRRSFWPTIKTLFPNIRIPLILFNEDITLGGVISGADKLGVVDYSALFLGSSSRISVTSRQIRPVLITFSKINQSEIFSLKHPIFFNALDKLQSAFIGANYDLDSIYPSFSANARYLNYELDSSLAFKLSSELKYSLTNKTTAHFNSSRLSLKTTTTQKMDHIAYLRGALNSVYENQNMTTASLDYIHKLTTHNAYSSKYKVLSGDLYGNIFIDYSSLNFSNTSTNFAYGYEFLLESAFNTINLVPLIGVSKTDNLNFYISFYLDI